jgi:RNA polymerase sigma-70 factor (ECF subfamily)
VARLRPFGSPAEGGRAMWRAAGPAAAPGLGAASAALPGALGARSRTGDAVAAGHGAAPEAPAGPSEAVLLDRARHGDAAAFEALLAPVMQPAYALAARLLGDRQLAEDVLQDALVKAFTGIRGFRGEARFSTWIFRIVHNACTDALRYQARRPRAAQERRADPEGPAPEPVDGAPGPEDVVMERQGRAALLAAIQGLAPEFRAAVLLRDVQGLSYEEVAAITGQNLGTVKSRLHRARAALRAALEGAGGPGRGPGTGAGAASSDGSGPGRP